MWEIWIQSLGQEDTLVKGMATHSHMLAWKTPWSEESGRLQSMGLQRVEHDWGTKHKVLLAPCKKKKKAMTNLASILKSWDITFPTKVHIIKVMVFPIVMYRCESWTIKKAEHWRIDAFELKCWRRLLRSPWTSWRSNHLS